MSPAHILGLIFLIALLPFMAGAFILAILSAFDNESISLGDDEED